MTGVDSSSAGKYRSLSDAESLRALVTNIREGVYIANASGQILDANPAFLSLLAIKDLAELGPHGFLHLLTDPSERTAEFERIDREGSVRACELQFMLPNGDHRTVLDSMCAVRDPDTGDVLYHGVLVDITQRKDTEDKLRRESSRDPLTGCFNRRWLDELAEQLSKNHDAKWGCIFVDIDHFKSYNETHGHQMGDTTLLRMSRFLMRQIRAEENVVRVGGDEFLIILDDADEAGTETVVKRLAQVALRTAPVPFSFGSAWRQGSESLHDTMHRADKNLLAVRVLERSQNARMSGAFKAQG